MAETSKNKNNVPTKPVDHWQSGRPRFNIQGFRLGKDKKWHFSGQQPDEEVRIVVRQHWWFLVQPALPFAGFVIGIFVVLALAAAFPKYDIIWAYLEGAVILLAIGAGAWFAWKDLAVWWLESYIITDKRIINSRGLLQPTRQETPIEKVQQVGIDIKTPLEVLLGFGTVHVYLVGGDLVMKHVPHPRKVKDALQGITDVIKSKKKKEEPIPVPQDPELASVLKKLAEGKAVPKLADADENYPAPANPDRVRGPRRTFGGILRIPSRIHYLSGEQTVKYIQRSQYVLLKNLTIPALLIVLILPVAIVPPSVGYIPTTLQTYWWLLMGILFLIFLVSLILVYINYIDDIYILTSRRIIDIERKFLFTFESRFEAEYKNLRDIKVKVPNVIERFLDIGDVYIETPGNSPDIVFKSVDHPFLIQDEIYAIRNHKDKEDKIKKENDERKMLQTWFGTVVSTLDSTTKIHPTPDLRNLDLLAAMACAQEIGMDVEVSGNAIPSNTVAPGHVVQQSPPHGTIMKLGSKIEIVLSKRPSPVDQI
ncbi:MAG: hypothetical protein NVS4B11_07310 [Ktedonobacteraceae bacterium]